MMVPGGDTERERKCRLNRIVQGQNCKAILADKCLCVLMAVASLILFVPVASAPQPSTNQNVPHCSERLLASLAFFGNNICQQI